MNATYRLLDLSLEGLDLGLKFVDEVLEPFLVLSVLVSLERKLLKATIGLAHVLLGLGMATLLTVEFAFQFTDLKGSRQTLYINTDTPSFSKQTWP